MYKAREIAVFFIEKGVTPLQLQKLLYYSQVWFFVREKRKLFSDEIQAWIYGPVVREVWEQLRFIRHSDIIVRGRLGFSDLQDDTVLFLNEIWNSYGHLSGAQLVDLTHSELPWKNSRKGLLSFEPSNKEVIINSNTTKEFELGMRGEIPFVPKSEKKGFISNF
ncbi:DUF4065 domain-containing protein [Ornithobacterium rhinotracheale]|uniref:Panacea domain-containing protein n=1 Tax=Ornithobacterium rhinotracheale TaxID=28251 RepID=UPI00129D13F6|nr:type II toxin-antitoxin system antitoxin SocA domain-containing protein [Ornithobacterium rhinotracheale]MRI62552.1 DUF4065 domain-containing protein [Ornithobacterium rhinotracheale]